MSHEMIKLICLLGGMLFVVAFFAVFYLLLRSLCRGFKNFLFELIDHANGTSSGANTRARKKDYTAEARRACEKVTPKKDKNATPPWEE